MPKPITAKQSMLIKRLYDAGMSYRSIAYDLDLSETTVRRHVAKPIQTIERPVDWDSKGNVTQWATRPKHR